MIRHILLGISMILMLSCFAVLAVKQWGMPQAQAPEQLQQELQEQPRPVITIPPAILRLNARLLQIRTLVCEDVTVKLWQRGIRAKLTGRLYFEKPSNFRFLARSVIADELDLGSNDKIFWFWSRRNKHPGVFYAEYKDYFKTRLKTPFNPIWLRETLSVTPVTDQVRIAEIKDSWVLYEASYNGIGQPIWKATYVNKSEEQIRKLLIMDHGGNILTMAEIIQTQQGIPTFIQYSWYEEGQRYMSLELKNIKLNCTINQAFWTMPNIQPQTDMAED